MKCFAGSAALCCLIATVAFAENSVLVESKSVASGADSVIIGIYVENDVAVMGAVFPMVVRSVSPGAFISGHLAVTPANRFTDHLTGWRVISYFAAEDNDRYWECGGVGFKTRGAPDFSSPDAFYFAGVKGQYDSSLYVGNDGVPPGGTPSLLVSFGVTSVSGTFEIDTTCITPANHLSFAVDAPPIYSFAPSFTKGVIEIHCECDCHTDPQCDGYYDIIDWLKIKNVSQGGAPIQDPNQFCPVVTTDVNCDGVTNSTDKDLMSEVVFNGGDPGALFCDPCP